MCNYEFNFFFFISHCIVCIYLPYTVKLEFFVPWIYIFFGCTCFFITAANTSMKTTLNSQHTYVISAQFLNYTFKLRINWHATAVLSVLVGHQANTLFSVTISYIYCLHIIHIICHAQWSTLSELPTPVQSYNTVARSGPVSVDQPGYSTVCIIWHRKMSTTCIVSIHNSCLQ
jgi:hypothetical protein